VRFLEALDDARLSLKLDALAYAERSHEKWLVLETYSRVFRDWLQIVPLSEADLWDCWMEIRLPTKTLEGRDNDVNRIDMAFGETEPYGGESSASKHKQPRSDTPVFEVKIVRSDSVGVWNQQKKNVRKDADKLISAGLRHGYIFVLYFLFDEI